MGSLTAASGQEGHLAKVKPHPRMNLLHSCVEPYVTYAHSIDICVNPDNYFATCYVV